ncbi:hypothetical protein HHK36_019705 [Tetracentron sinense]|uniref:Ataxin-2 C-terminal domain-containing protein n=1 Tax=Tetracentron sinense TaxID=13715 RepID=A0A834YU42_TETSI|nr:hypothetical protein HHK36_019705 [Tetracentron sinense]
MSIASGGRSALNPDAPLFIPAAFRQVEDFSQEWWELVKTSKWFHEYWLNQHQEEERFDGNADDEAYVDDVANLLPESFDFGIDEELPNLEAQLEELVQYSEAGGENEPAISVLKKERPRNGLETDAEILMKNLSLLKSSKENGPKSEPAKYCEKPAQCISPKCSTRRIHQPR